MILGLEGFASSLIPTWSSSGHFGVNLFPLASGILAFYAGLSMLRLSEFGRKLVIALLLIRLTINVWVFLHLKTGAWAGLNYFGEQIYRFENRYAYPGLLLAGILTALLTIIFLSQKETRQFFMTESTDDAGSTKMNSDDIETGSDIFI